MILTFITRITFCEDVRFRFWTLFYTQLMSFIGKYFVLFILDFQYKNFKLKLNCGIKRKLSRPSGVFLPFVVHFFKRARESKITSRCLRSLIGQLSFLLVPIMVLSKMNNHEHRTTQTYESYTFQPFIGFW